MNVNLNRILQYIGIFIGKEQQEKDTKCRCIVSEIITLLDEPVRNVSALKDKLIKLQKNLPSDLYITDYLTKDEIVEAFNSVDMTAEEFIEKSKTSS